LIASRSSTLLVLATLAAGSLVLGNAALADADELPRPINLRVADGEDTWHPVNSFQLDWDRPAATVTAIDLRIGNSEGSAQETHFPFDRHVLELIHVPSGPGRYVAEVSLENERGERGPAEKVTLLFDNARPRPARPLTPTGWIADGSAASVRIERPASPQPASGIRGYAVSVSRDGDVAPCAGPDRCSGAETDLPGGIGDDTISLGPLPEGPSVVRAVAVSGSGMRSEETGSATVWVDATEPKVVLNGVPPGWARGPVRLTADAADALSGMVAAGPMGPFTALGVDDGPPKVAEGDSVAAVVSGDGSHTIAYYARDAAGNVADGSGPRAPETEIVRIDGGPPRVVFAKSQDLADPERIEATVTDPLSGPDPARGSIAVRAAGSGQPFAPLPTTASGGTLSARWDSDSFPAGDYEFRATGFDAAGNSVEGERRSTGARMVLPSPLKMPTSLEAGFGGQRLIWRTCERTAAGRRCRRQAIGPYELRPTARTVPYGRGVQFGGRLTTLAGAPLAGLPIQVLETFDPGAEPGLRTSMVQTATDGTFTAHLAPGPSRHVEAVFAGNRILTRAVDDPVRLGVGAGIHLHASAATAKIGGAPVLFSGRIGGPGGSMPATGRPVELQFRLPGTEWTEFRTVQTDAQGRFRYPYAFSDDDSRGVRFQFRAYAPSGPGWPYEPAASRPVVVLGR
jgi:hypothetical protein